MNNYATARTALLARFDAALALAQTVEPSFLLVNDSDNEEPWEATGDEYVLRVFDADIVATRPAVGNPFDRIFRRAHVDIFIPREIGGALGAQIFETIAPAFLTGATPDDLIFEGPATLTRGRKSGGAWFQSALFPYHFNRPRPAV